MSTSVKGKTPRGLPPVSPQEDCLRQVSQIVYRGQIPLGIPGKRQGGRLVEMAHQEDPDCANKKHQRHEYEADPVNHPCHQEPLLVLLLGEVGG